MKNILNCFLKWEKNKILHFVFALAVSVLAALVVKLIGGEKYCILCASWFCGLLAGFAKEVYDENVHKIGDMNDWIADVIGATIGTILTFIFIV